MILTEKIMKSESDEETEVDSKLTGWTQRVQQHMLGAKWLQSILAEKGLGIPPDTKLNMRQ